MPSYDGLAFTFMLLLDWRRCTDECSHVLQLDWPSSHNIWGSSPILLAHIPHLTSTSWTCPYKPITSTLSCSTLLCLLYGKTSIIQHLGYPKSENLLTLKIFKIEKIYIKIKNKIYIKIWIILFNYTINVSLAYCWLL